MLDPGPGTLLRCAQPEPRVDATKLTGIVLTHMGTNLLKAGPERTAQRLSDDLGITATSATDGMIVELP
jgi:hypothetical protein